MATTYLNLRWKIEGLLVTETWPPIYVGGRIEYSFNIDFDHLSIPELADIAKEFGVIKLGTIYIASKDGPLIKLTKDGDLVNLGLLLKNGDTIDIYVCNDSTFEEDVGPIKLDVVGGDSNGQSSKSSVDNRESYNILTPNPPVLGATPTTDLILTNPSSSHSSKRTEQAASDDFEGLIDAASDYLEGNNCIGGDFEEEGSIESDSEVSDDYGSDVHEELRVVREDLKKYEKAKKVKAPPKKKLDGFLGEAGLDEGYEDIDKEKTNLRDKLGGDDDEKYYDSSDVDSFVSKSDGEKVSDDEEEGGHLRARRKSNRVVYDPDCEKVIWQVGQVFENVNEFREVLTKYALKKGVQLVKKKNDQKRVRAVCREGCPWMILASREGRSTNFTVKTYNPRHKCHKTTNNFLCNSKFLSKHYKERIISQPTIKGREIQNLVRKDFGVYVGKSICLKTRKLVLREVMGDHVAEFGRLFDYRDILLQTNPGSTCIIKVIDRDDGKKEFVGFYICFVAMKLGFMNGCRKCIGLDGCFLKGICKGQLLVAVAKDGNNQMFPIAWAVTGVEKKETWRWFMRILQDDLQLGNGDQITIISDMQKGLISAAEEVFPACEHRMCARHILSNWSKKWKGIERRKKFWKCVRATFESELKLRLDELSKLGKNIVEDLITYNIEGWCKVYFEEFSKCDSVDNNMAESFNAWILAARHKTIVSMLEEIRIKMMNRIAKMRTFAATWIDGISPMALKVFNANVERSMNCILNWNGDSGFEVKEGQSDHIVHLGKAYCSCRTWQLKGIPCAHAIASMHYKRIDPAEFIVDWYKIETYVQAYSHFIQLVPSMKMWPDSSNPKIEPPAVVKMPGRPKRNRRKEVGEVKKAGKLPKMGIAMTCSLCKSSKHNKKGCPLKPKATNAVHNSSQATINESTNFQAAAAPSRRKYATPPKFTTRFNTSQQSSTASTKKGEAIDTQEGGSITNFKRPRIVGKGVFVSESGYSCVNQGTSSSRIVSVPKVLNSAEVTGDIGYKPSKGLKWKGKKTITQQELQMQSAMHKAQKKSKALEIQTRAQTEKSPTMKIS